MANYLNLNNGKVLTECELYDLLACGCSRKNYTKWRWENETTHVNHLGRDWWKIWEVTPPSGCSGCEVPINIVAPQTIGTGELGDTLICGDGTWTGTLPITYTYQWYQDGIAIPTQDSNRLVIIEDYIGTEVWCIVTATNACGDGTGESNHVLCYSEPLALTAPQTSGSLLVGGTITRVAGTYAGTTPITLTYQWLNGGGTVLGTGTSYVVQQSDFGGTIRVKEIATNIHGSINQSTSNQTILSAPVNTAINTISGNDYVGQVLTSTTGTFIGTASITYGYQWQRDGVNIVGATASTYTLVSADADKDIRCVVTATNAYYGSATATSSTIYAFTAEYQAIRAEGIAIGATAPSTAQQKLENKILTQMIANGAWTTLDRFGSLATDGDTLWRSMNWKNPSGTKFVFNGSGTMVSLEGYKLDGSTAWIDTNLNLNSATKYTTSNSSIGVYGSGKNFSKGITGGMLWGASDGTFQVYANNQAAATGVWEGRMGSGTTRTTTDIRKAEFHYSQEYNGTNTIIRVGSTAYTTAQTGAYTRPNFNLGIGCRNKTAPDQFSNGTIAYFYIGDSTAPVLVKSVLDSVTPSIFPAVTPAVLQADYDMNNTAKLWQNTAKTTPATVANDPVRVVEPTSGTWGDLVASSDAQRPLIQSWAGPSKLILDFDGTDDSFDLPATITGDHTLLWVAKNDDATNGSHLIYGSNYIPLTGSSYSGNSSYSGEYFVPHPSGTATGGVRVKNQSLAYNVIAVRLNGQEWTSMNGLCESVKASSANSFSWTKLGKEYLANWQLDGKLGRFIYYSGALTDKELQDLIISLNTTYGI